jgi:hypothetical protein
VSISDHVRSFSFSTYNRFGNRENTCGYEYSLWGHQYSNMTAHGQSLLHPFYHVGRVFFDSARLLQGAILVIASPFSLNLRVVGDALKAFIGQAACILMDIINCVSSVISLVTSTFGTVLRCGYLESNLNHAFAGREMGGRNSETTMNMLGGMFGGQMLQANRQAEVESHYYTTCSL